MSRREDELKYKKYVYKTSRRRLYPKHYKRLAREVLLYLKVTVYERL